MTRRPDRSLRILPVPALLSLLSLFSLVPPPLHADWEQGVAAVHQGNFEVALQHFQAVTEAQPDFAGGHEMVGQMQTKLGRWSEAADSFARAYELQPQAKPGLILAWGRALIESDEPEKAVSVLDKIDPARLDPSQRDLYHALMSQALLDMEPPARALERLSQLARANPESPILWQALGHALARADRPDEAADAFDHALDLVGKDPALARAYVNSAFTAARSTADADSRRAWYARAVEAAERLVAQEPTVDHWLLLGEAHLGAQQYREAVGAFEKAAVVAPKDPLTDFYLGEAFLGLEEGDRAEWVLRDALRKRPGPDLVKRIHSKLGRSHHLQKEYLQAAREYRTAGDEERAALMEQYQKLADENDRIERDRRLCEQRLGELRQLMADSKGLEGTPEWKQLENDLARLREACG